MISTNPESAASARKTQGGSWEEEEKRRAHGGCGRVNILNEPETDRFDGKRPIYSRLVGGKKRCFEQARTNNSANTDRRTKSMGRWTYAERWGQEETDIMYDDGGQLSCLYIYHLFFPFYFIRRFGIQGGRGSIIIISSIPMYEIYRRAFVFLFSHSLCTV